MNASRYKYDVCFSFAGEDRPYVEQVAAELVAHGIRVFYDRHERVETWGKDLYQLFSDVYRKHARFCVIFISAAYASKLWTRHELRNAQARAFDENREYILPARFDDTEIPGVLPTVAYIDVSRILPEEFASLVMEKIRAAADDPAEEARAERRAPGIPALATPPVLAGQPQVAAIRRRISEPLDACEAYRDTVENLVHAGRWVFTIGVAYPPELLAADDLLLAKLRSFAGELRTAMAKIDAEDSKRRAGMPGILALAPNPIAEVRAALADATAATEKLRDLRQLMRSAIDRNRIRESAIYQGAVTALNRIVETIEEAQEKRDIDLHFFQLFVDHAKNSPR